MSKYENIQGLEWKSCQLTHVHLCVSNPDCQAS